jgi:vesicle coat complex subunit
VLCIILYKLLVLCFKYFSICERITPRLAHANAAVVLSAIKVLMKLMEMLPTDSDFVTTLTKKLAPPLVTLLSTEPEVIYIYLH